MILDGSEEAKKKGRASQWCRYLYIFVVCLPLFFSPILFHCLATTVSSLSEECMSTIPKENKAEMYPFARPKKPSK